MAPWPSSDTAGALTVWSCCTPRSPRRSAAMASAGCSSKRVSRAAPAGGGRVAAGGRQPGGGERRGGGGPWGGGGPRAGGGGPGGRGGGGGARGGRGGAPWVLGGFAPVDVDVLGHVGMALEPAAG